MKSALEEIKELAERGFEDGDAAWEQNQTAAVAALDALATRAGDFYGVRESGA